MTSPAPTNDTPAPRWTASSYHIMQDGFSAAHACNATIAARLAACADKLREFGELGECVVGQWVPCSERMPEPLVGVIGLTVTHEQRMVYADRSEDDGPLYFLCDVNGGRLDGVTHWIPLPALPTPSPAKG